MKNISKIIIIVVSIFIIIGAIYSNNINKQNTIIPKAKENSKKWFSQEQVALGADIFKNNCAICHGKKAQKTTNWKKTLADGSYPPPPLNGNAHSWHHPYSQLFRIISDGGVSYDGKMPPFKDKLTPQEIENAISYFQNFWPDDKYDIWIQNGGLKGK